LVADPWREVCAGRAKQFLGSFYFPDKNLDPNTRLRVAREEVCSSAKRSKPRQTGLLTQFDRDRPEAAHQPSPAQAPPGETTHWAAGMMSQGGRRQRLFGPADLAGFAIAPGGPLQAVRPEFAPKLRKIVGLYVDPPAYKRRLRPDSLCRVTEWQRRAAARR
jgi:hypothetical protein